MHGFNVAFNRRYRRHKGFAGDDLQCIAENRLDRQFDPAQPNTCWIKDFNYERIQEDSLYATVVIYLFSR